MKIAFALHCGVLHFYFSFLPSARNDYNADDADASIFAFSRRDDRVCIIFVSGVILVIAQCLRWYFLVLCVHKKGICQKTGWYYWTK